MKPDIVTAQVGHLKTAIEAEDEEAATFIAVNLLGGALFNLAIIAEKLTEGKST